MRCTVVEDIVCRMIVDETDPLTPTREFNGKTYYFCCVECKIMFDREPEVFIADVAVHADVVRDIVCGSVVRVDSVQWKLKYHGRWRYFCSASCLREFERNPSRFVYLWS